MQRINILLDFMIGSIREIKFLAGKTRYTVREYFQVVFFDNYKHMCLITRVYGNAELVEYVILL